MKFMILVEIAYTKLLKSCTTKFLIFWCYVFKTIHLKWINKWTYFQTIESAIGYAWLPLVKGDRLVIESDEQEVALPVASELPKDYISYQSLGLGKGVINF